MNPDYSTIKVEIGSGICRVRLARPEALNAISESMIEELNQVLDDVESSELRVLVLTGEGRAFCAGADLKDIRSRTEGLSDQEASERNACFSRRLGELLLRIESLPRPVIGVVNGVAVAGGLELLLCCDMVVAADTARMGDAHGAYGLLPGAGASVRLPRKVGVGFAKHVMFSGEILPAKDWAAAGLVQVLVPAEDLASTAEALAGRLSRMSPLVIARMKSLIDSGLDLSRSTALEREQQANRDHAGSLDRREGLAAFAQRRRPEFTGR